MDNITFIQTHKNNTRPLLTGRVNSHNNLPSGNLAIDWLQGTFPAFFTSNIVDYISKLLNLEPISCNYGFNRYDCSYLWEPYDVKILYDSTVDRCNNLHRGRSTLIMPASALKPLSSKQILKLLHDLKSKFNFDCTRCDFAFDDYSKILSPSFVAEQAKNGNISGFRKYEYRTGKCIIGQPESSNGETCTFGSRGKNGSGKYLRFYDKDKESNGEIPAYRMELELSKEMAKTAFLRISTSKNVNYMNSCIGSFLGGCIDFIDRSVNPKEKNLKRFSRLDWWQKIVSLLGCLKLQSVKKVKTIEKAIDWIERSVSSTLAMLRKVSPEDFDVWLKNQIDEGEKRLSPSHLQRIHCFQAS